MKKDNMIIDPTKLKEVLKGEEFLGEKFEKVAKDNEKKQKTIQEVFEARDKESILVGITSENPEQAQKIAEEYSALKYELSVDDFNVELTEEQTKKLESDTLKAKEIQRKLNDLDPCDDLHICEVAAKHMAQEIEGPEVKLLYFLIGKKCVQKLKALGYRLYCKNIDVELLQKASISLSTKEQKLLKSIVSAYQNSEIDFEMLIDLLNNKD